MNTQDLIALDEIEEDIDRRVECNHTVMPIEDVRNYIKAIRSALAAAQPKADEPTGPDWHKIADERAAEIVRLTTKADERGSAEPDKIVMQVPAADIEHYREPSTAPARDGSEPGLRMPSDGDYLRWAEREGATVNWDSERSGPAVVISTAGQWGRFCDRVRAATPEQRAEPQGLEPEEILRIANGWFVTGENQKDFEGYRYRSLGLQSNVKARHLVEFAQAIAARASAGRAA